MPTKVAASDPILSNSDEIKAKSVTTMTASVRKVGKVLKQRLKVLHYWINITGGRKFKNIHLNYYN